MSSHITNMALVNLSTAFQLLAEHSSSAVLLALLWVLWRLWTFTILPAFRPDEPKQVPYLIPYIGHAVSFFKDAHKTLVCGREYFNDTREPFAITIAGTKIYVMTSSDDISSVFKNTEQLTFDDYIKNMMLQFGTTPEAVDKMWQTPTNDNLNSATLQPNPSLKSFVHLSEGLYRQQLHPGEKLNTLQNVLLGNIYSSLTWESMTEKVIISSTENERTVSLYEWTRQVLLDGATRAFFGDKLLEMDPNLFEDFFYFDDNSWKLTYKIPRYWSNDVYAAKQKAQDALEAYFCLPKEERPGEAWIIHVLETEMRALGITEPDIASILMMTFWVINGNAYKLCFWILTYILHNPSLHKTILNEIITPAAAINASTSSPNDLATHLDKEKSCPTLTALFNETLRLTSSSSSIRNVLEQTTIGNKSLRKGTKVLIPFRHLHFNPHIFGPDAQVFNPDRFLEKRELSRSANFRPFGGGTTHCPGRFLAKREILVFTALVLTRFDLELAGGGGTTATEGEKGGGPRFPRLEDGKPCLGIMGPVSGDDVVVRVRQVKQ